MNIRKTIPILLLAISLLATAVSAQELKWNVGFDFNFDNREYGDLQIPSQTLFGARLSPEIGLAWGPRDRHSLMVGVDVVKAFGRDRFCEDPELVMYYGYRSDKFRVSAGIFPRSRMIGEYSQAIFSDSVRFYDNNIEGLLLQYTGKRGFVEVGIDWDGIYSRDEREKFRIFSSGNYSTGIFTGGYALSVYHFAGSYDIKGVVDNIIVNPYAGFDMSRRWPLQRARLTAGWLQTMQRDRISEQKAVHPGGFQLKLDLRKWNFGIDNTFYTGDGLMPYFQLYGGELYAGERFYQMQGGKCYDRLEIYYDKLWSSKADVSLHAGFVFHFIAGKMVTQQVVQLKVAIDNDRFSRKNNKHHKH